MRVDEMCILRGETPDWGLFRRDTLKPRKITALACRGRGGRTSYYYPLKASLDGMTGSYFSPHDEKSF